MDNSASVCVINIGAAERRKRLKFGIAAFSVGVVTAILLIVTGAQSLWRLSLFLPFYVGAIGFFQARDRT